MSVNMLLSGVSDQRNPVWCGLTQRAQLVSIPDVEDLSDECFKECETISLVTFGESSSFRRIGVKAFYGSGLREVHIPDSLEELGEECFVACKNRSRVTFGDSSSLKRIGVRAFFGCSLAEIHIPNSVEELCEECFKECKSLSRVPLASPLLSSCSVMGHSVVLV